MQQQQELTPHALRDFSSWHPFSLKLQPKTENDARARNYRPSPTAGIPLQRGPWYDFWRALGGSDAIYHGLDATERAWLQIESNARLTSAREIPGPFNTYCGTFCRGTTRRGTPCQEATAAS